MLNSRKSTSRGLISNQIKKGYKNEMRRHSGLFCFVNNTSCEVLDD